MFIVIATANKTSCTSGLEVDMEKLRDSGALRSFVSSVSLQLRRLNFCQANALSPQLSVADKLPQAHTNRRGALGNTALGR